MTGFTSSNFEETADLLRFGSSREDIPAVILSRLSLILSALDLAAQINVTSECPWENIDSAPKDGTKILVADYPNVIYLASWREWMIGDDNLVDRGWYWREARNGRPGSPTRWLKIPADTGYEYR